MITLALLSLVIAVAESSSIEHCSHDDFKKVGCFKKDESLFHEIMITDLDPTHHKWGKDIDWADFQKSLHSLACRCEAKVRGKYNYFAIGFYGECWAGSNTKAIRDKVYKPGQHTSDQCIGGDYEKCDKGSKHECAGTEDNEYVYQIVEKKDKACPRPSGGCTASYDVYKHVDCDGDGILDHACSTTINNNHWLVLSSEGCPNNWGTNERAVSKCSQAWSKASSYKCYHWNKRDIATLKAGKGTKEDEKRYCEGQLGLKFSGGNEALASGCGGCWCCKRVDGDCNMNGYGIPGNDVTGNIGATNWQECADKCFANEKCNFWTFTPTSNTCFLKANKASLTKMKGKISGSKSCRR